MGDVRRVRLVLLESCDGKTAECGEWRWHMGCACSAVGANLWRGGMRQGLQGECGIGGWGEIGEDTGEPLEGRIQQDSINNPVI